MPSNEAGVYYNQVSGDDMGRPGLKLKIRTTAALNNIRLVTRLVLLTKKKNILADFLSKFTRIWTFEYSPAVLTGTAGTKLYKNQLF